LPPRVREFGVGTGRLSGHCEMNRCTAREASLHPKSSMSMARKLWLAKHRHITHNLGFECKRLIATLDLRIARQHDIICLMAGAASANAIVVSMAQNIWLGGILVLTLQNGFFYRLVSRLTLSQQEPLRR